MQISATVWTGTEVAGTAPLDGVRLRQLERALRRLITQPATVYETEVHPVGTGGYVVAVVARQDNAGKRSIVGAAMAGPVRLDDAVVAGVSAKSKYADLAALEHALGETVRRGR